MLRAFSSRKSSSGYERLDQDSDSVDNPPQPGLTRARSVPPGILLFGFSKQAPLPPQNASSKSKKDKKSHHPVFSMFEGRWRKKKVTAKPEVARYMDYLKEGGRWDTDTDKPVMHYSN